MRILSVVVFAFFTLFASGCKKQNQYDKEWESKKGIINAEVDEAQRIVDNGVANPEEVDPRRLDKFIQRCETVLHAWQGAMLNLGTQAKQELADVIGRLTGLIMKAKALQVAVNNRPSVDLIQKAKPTPPSFVQNPPSFVPKPVTSSSVHDVEWRGLEPKIRANVVEMEKSITEYLSGGTTTAAGLRGLINHIDLRIIKLRQAKTLVNETNARQIDEFISRYSALRNKLQTALATK